jgi:hypothetical protein
LTSPLNMPLVRRQLGPPSSGGRAAPSKATINGARMGAKGGKKGQKQCPPQHVAFAASNDGDNEKADDSGQEYVTAAEYNFRC